MRHILITLFALLFIQGIYAQNVITVKNQETGKEEEIDIPESLRRDLDEKMQTWQIKNYVNKDETCRSTDSNPIVSDEIIMDRLARIPSVIEMPFNEAIRKFIDYYASSLRTRVSYMLAATNFYIPLFEEALDLYNLPLELKYLPIIESALNPKAISRQGAAGLWQFMIKTGKIYGLKTNSLVDERQDPVKSTWAAVRYLKDLYDMYGDWNLVLASYNAGPGTINKAIKRSGGKTDYWEIYPYLPKETRGYVPGFIAANYIMTYYCEHGICPMNAELPAQTDTVMVNKDINLNQIAEVCKVDIDELRGLNPQYRRDIVPGKSDLSAIRLPNNTLSIFLANQDSIISYQADKYLSKRQRVEISKNTAQWKKGKQSRSASGEISYHKIRKGETLGGIARKYHTTVSNLRKLNGISGNNIQAGKSIRVK